jgi:3-hydroxymyristoyl/3-hydroxydecanoyl-(acyl carrier protein) dehydratase
MEPFKELRNAKGEIETENIKKIIPYNEHFLFVDRVIELTNNKIVALKELSGREDFFKGHFVNFPIMPGALTVEGMGQAATLLARANIRNHQEKLVLAYKLKDVKFMAPVFPPVHLRFVIDLIAQDERGAVAVGKSYVKDNLVAEAYFTIAIVDKAEFQSKFSK